jgi:hypothetical protein
MNKGLIFKIAVFSILFALIGYLFYHIHILNKELEYKSLDIKKLQEQREHYIQTAKVLEERLIVQDSLITTTFVKAKDENIILINSANLSDVKRILTEAARDTSRYNMPNE